MRYFETKRVALRALKMKDPKGIYGLHVFKMPKGTRHHDKYAVCTEMEFLNAY